MDLSWYINRFLKMPLPEIPWRIWEKIKKIRDHNRNFKAPETACMPEQSIFLLACHVNSAIFGTLFSDTIQEHISIADLALKHQFSPFGVEIIFDDDINWALDPITGKQWPNEFWGDIDYRDKRFGGIKFVWEINRFYFLVSLAISYRYTKERKYADKIVWFIISWLESNPYPIGVNWASGIELGVRLANLIWALSFLEDYHFSDNDLKIINSFVWFHAQHLERYPSKFSSSNNHLLAEGFGLFVAGLYFPHIQNSEQWFSMGKDILEKEVTRQILSDGGSFEYSTTYLSFVFDIFLLFKISCDRSGVKYSRNIDERLEKSCEFIKSIIDENGHIPNIGDQDSAVLVDFGLSNMDNFVSILNTGAILFDRKDFQLSGVEHDFKTWILAGDSCSSHKYIDKFISMKENDKQIDISDHCSEKLFKGRDELLSKPVYHIHKQSGLAVIRDYANAEEILFIGNAMPLGMAPLYAHGHLDALSFNLSVGGMEFFIDPGTYLYHNGGKWRTYFRSTAAHNTIRINKTDISEQTGDFMFGRPYKIIKHSLEKINNKIIWSAAHDGYLNKEPFSHVMREVIWDVDKKWFIFSDIIRQNKEAFVEMFFHCHPECRIILSDSNDCCGNGKEIYIERNNIGIKLISPSSMNCEILSGSHNPVLGWYSPCFNRIMETSTIRFYTNIAGEMKFITKIVID